MRYEYTEAIGEAGDRYLSSKTLSGYSHHLPATFRWYELWDAMHNAARKEQANEELELELYVDGEMVVSACGPREDVMAEMRRYWAQYADDGECSIYEVERKQVNILDVLNVERAADEVTDG